MGHAGIVVWNIIEDILPIQNRRASEIYPISDIQHRLSYPWGPRDSNGQETGLPSNRQLREGQSVRVDAHVDGLHGGRDNGRVHSHTGVGGGADEGVVAGHQDAKVGVGRHPLGGVDKEGGILGMEGAQGWIGGRIWKQMRWNYARLIISLGIERNNLRKSLAMAIVNLLRI